MNKASRIAGATMAGITLGALLAAGTAHADAIPQPLCDGSSSQCDVAVANGEYGLPAETLPDGAATRRYGCDGQPTWCDGYRKVVTVQWTRCRHDCAGRGAVRRRGHRGRWFRTTVGAYVAR